MVEQALSRQNSADKSLEKQSKTPTFKYQVEDFTNFESDFGHSDLSLSVGIVKHFDLIMRKYFCNKEVPFEARLPFGRLLNTKTTLRFMPDCDDLRLAMNCLVQKRNDIVHNFMTEKFESEACRRAFIDVTNVVLLELKKLVLRPKAIDPARKNAPVGEATKVVYKAADLNDPDSDVPAAIKARFKIKESADTSSRDDLIRYHCWKMVKLDKSLQESIQEDADGLFSQVLPIEVKEYVSIVPC